LATGLRLILDRVSNQGLRTASEKDHLVQSNPSFAHLQSFVVAFPNSMPELQRRSFLGMFVPFEERSLNKMVRLLLVDWLVAPSLSRRGRSF